MLLPFKPADVKRAVEELYERGYFMQTTTVKTTCDYCGKDITDKLIFKVSNFSFTAATAGIDFGHMWSEFCNVICFLKKVKEYMGVDKDV